MSYKQRPIGSLISELGVHAFRKQKYGFNARLNIAASKAPNLTEKLADLAREELLGADDSINAAGMQSS